MNDNNEPRVHGSSSEAVGNWIFSLIPVGVAFVFYVVFIITAELENKDVFLAFGATAAFIGLESYWIMRGMRENSTGIVVTGLIGIAVTLGALYLYMSFA
jgi:hypothetical protein